MKKFLLLGIFSLGLISCDESADISNDAANMPVEQKLATIDANGLVEQNEIKVIRIKTLLKYLSEAYQEPVDSIADLTNRAQGVIHDRGIEETNLNILEEMNKAGKIENTPYRDAVTFYALMRTRGMD